MKMLKGQVKILPLARSTLRIFSTFPIGPVGKILSIEPCSVTALRAEATAHSWVCPLKISQSFSAAGYNRHKQPHNHSGPVEIINIYLVTPVNGYSKWHPAIRGLRHKTVCLAVSVLLYESLLFSCTACVYRKPQCHNLRYLISSTH